MGDIGSTQQFVDGQLGVNGHDLNNILGQSFAQPQLISGKTQASGPATNGSDQFLILQTGNTFARLAYSNLFLPAYVRPAAGIPQYVSTINGDASVWQPGTTFNNLGTGGLAGPLADMWKVNGALTGTGRLSVTQLDTNGTLVGGANNYRPRWCIQCAPGTAQATISSGEYCYITQRIERALARKLFDNPTSLSLWLKTIVITGVFSVAIRNADGSQCYKQDVAINTAGVWQRVAIPNIPAMPDSSGNWGTAETDPSYEIDIVLAAGSTFQAATQNSWFAGNFLATGSQANLFTSTSNALQICLLQHESGAACTPYYPDEDIGETFRRVQRYWCKSYVYSAYAGNSSNANGAIAFGAQSASSAIGYAKFPQTMRVAPNVTIYSPLTGSSGKAEDIVAATDRTVSSVGNVGDSGFDQLGTSSLSAAGSGYTGGLLFQYTADASV